MIFKIGDKIIIKKVAELEYSNKRGVVSSVKDFYTPDNKSYQLIEVSVTDHNLYPNLTLFGHQVILDLEEIRDEKINKIIENEK